MTAMLLMCSCCTTTQRDASAWEYRVIDGYLPDRDNPYIRPEDLLQTRLDAAAKEGWVVVSSSSGDTVPSSTPHVVVILKRLKQ